LAFCFDDVFAANDNFACHNRLTKATKLDGTVLDFRYDGDGLRMESIKNGGAIDANYQISGGTRTRYVTSATEEIADISGARVVLARYIAGPAIDERIAQVDANGAVKYIHTDKQNSVVAISNSSGAVISRRGYGSYGETTPTQLASNDNSPTHPFGYTGRRWDADLGLYYYRARWYDPELGTFLETDPIGSLDYINLYSYVGLSPMNAVDPSGLETINVSSMPANIKIKAYPGPEATIGGRVEHGPPHVHVESPAGRGNRSATVSTETWEVTENSRPLSRAEQRAINNMTAAERNATASAQSDIFRKGRISPATIEKQITAHNERTSGNNKYSEDRYPNGSRNRQEYENSRSARPPPRGAVRPPRGGRTNGD